LKSHEGHVHHIDSPYTSSCSESQRHHANIHSGKYKCMECGKCFGTSESLAAHRQNHSGAAVMRHVCGQCSARFMQLSQLEQHLLESHGEGTLSGCNVPQ